MRADFNVQAMEEKIRKNLELGWTPETIQLALLEEMQGCYKKMRIIEERVMELADQIEYVDEKYGKSS